MRPIITNYLKGFAKKIYYDILTEHKKFNDSNLENPFFKDKKNTKWKIEETIKIYEDENR